MSGGCFDYIQHRMQDVADQLEERIEEGSENTEGFSGNTLVEFMTATEHLKKAIVYVQRIDWLLSGDDSEETFHERLREDLKEI